MTEGRPFQIALAVSIVGHVAVVVGGVSLPWAVPKHLTSAVQVTYVAPRLVEAKPQPTVKPPPPRPRTPAPSASVRTSRRSGAPPAAVATGRSLPAVPVKPAATATAVASPRAPSSSAVGLDIVPATSPLLLKEPTFQLYYRAIRERIRTKAYEVVPRPFQRGEIRLSFVVARNGELSALQLDELQSSPIEALRQAALRSVREAAPFAAFPPTVTQAQIAFAIVISFEEEPVP